MFRGVTHLALDNKGRLAIPARHRDALMHQGDGKLVLTADPSHCLLLYPLPNWDPIQQRLDGAVQLQRQESAALQRLLVGHADDVEVGRCRPHPRRRRRCASTPRLEKRVVLVGQGNKFELWDEAKWLERDRAGNRFPGGGLPPELDGFSL
mgnify:CR=1 FL=1